MRCVIVHAGRRLSRLFRTPHKRPVSCDGAWQTSRVVEARARHVESTPAKSGLARDPDQGLTGCSLASRVFDEPSVPSVIAQRGRNLRDLVETFPKVSRHPRLIPHNCIEKSQSDLRESGRKLRLVH